MTETLWRDIAKRFCIPSALLKAVGRKTTSIMVDFHKLQGRDPYAETGDTLSLCTINTSTSTQEGFAISAAHFKDANLTLAVVLGATRGQVDRAETLLSNANEAIGHPLLLLGLSAELMLELLTESIETMRDSCITLTLAFREALYGKSLEGDGTTKVDELRYTALRLHEEAKTFKESLQKALEFLCPEYKDVTVNDIDIYTVAAPTSGSSLSSGNSSTGTTSHEKHQHFVTTKISMRFQNIVSELNYLIALTRLSGDEISSMSSTVSPSPTPHLHMCL